MGLAAFLPREAYIHIAVASFCSCEPSEGIGRLSKARSIRRVGPVLGKGGIKAEEGHGEQFPVQVCARIGVVGYAI